MSLLPSRIIPATEPIGHLDDDGKTVIIEKNYWLFLYNLSLQVLGTGSAGTPGTPGTPGAPGAPGGSPILSPAMLLAAADTDIADADAMALRQPIENLNRQFADLPPTAYDFPDIARALLLAQDVPLPDPLPQAQPATVITVTASPFTYTAAFDGEVVITGTVTSVAIVRQGTSVPTGLLVGIFPIRRRDQLVVVYPAAAPTMTFLPT